MFLRYSTFSMLCTIDLITCLYQSIGAVNCIIRRPNDGKLFGCNTDYVGAISAIEEGLRGFIIYVSLTKKTSLQK